MKRDERDFYTIPLQEQYDILVDAYARISGVPKEFIQKDHKKQAGDDLQKKHEIALQDVCGILGMEPGDIETVASLQQKIEEESEFIIELNASGLPQQINEVLKDLRHRNIAKLNDPTLVGTDHLPKLQHDFYKTFVQDDEEGINQALCDLTSHYSSLGTAKRLNLLAQAKNTLYGENAEDVTAKFLAAAHTPEGAIEALAHEVRDCLKDTKTHSPLDDVIEYVGELDHGDDHMLEAVIGVIVKKIKALDGPEPGQNPATAATHTAPNKRLH